MSTMFQSMSPNLMVADVKAGVDFYCQILGFEMINTVDQDGIQVWAMLKKDNVTVMLHEANSMKSEYETFQTASVGGSLLLFFVISDIESLHAFVKDKHPLERPLHDSPYGMREFSIKDNSGYVLTFAQMLDT